MAFRGSPFLSCRIGQYEEGGRVSGTGNRTRPGLSRLLGGEIGGANPPPLGLLGRKEK